MKDLVNFDIFKQLDLRIGEITSAERISKSNKLLKLTVNFGDDGDRQIVAGIGKSYDAEDVVDTTAVFVLNLESTTIMGVESQGMILASRDLDGDICLVTTDCDALVGAAVG